MVSYNIPFNKVVTHEYYELHVNEGCGPPVQNAHIIILLIAVATGDIIASITLTAFFSCSESDRSLNMGLPLHSLKKKKKNWREGSWVILRRRLKTAIRHCSTYPTRLTHFNCEGVRNLETYMKAAISSGYWLFTQPISLAWNNKGRRGE